MKVVLLVFFHQFFLSHSYAQELLLYNNEIIAGRSGGGPENSFNTIVDIPASEPGTQAKPYISYIPMDNQALEEGKNAELQSLLRLRTSIPDLPLNSTTGINYVGLRVMQNYGGNRRLYLAAKEEGDNFEIVEVGLSPLLINSTNSDIIGSGEGSNVYLYFRIRDVCKIGNCDMGDGSNPEAEVDESQLIYAFTTHESTQLSVGSTIDVTEEQYQKGKFFKLYFSNRIPEAGSDWTLQELDPGDGQAILLFGGIVDNIDNFGVYRTVVYDYADTEERSSRTFDSIVPDFDAANFRLYDPVRDGEFTATGLNNGTNYNLAVALVNKFQFISTLTNSKLVTPMQIESFIQEQSCFLLSAGFGSSHYIIDYFRNFRDQTLLESTAGQLFVKTYYKWAPHYTRYIYNNSLLAGLVRGFSYTLYFAFEYTLVFILILSFFPFICIVTWKHFLSMRSGA